MESSLRKIVFGNKIERKFTDGMMIGGIIIPIIKLYQYDAVIYGGGQDVPSLILYLWANDVSVKAIIDRDEEKRGKRVLDKVPIIHTSDMGMIENASNVFVIVDIKSLPDMELTEITNLLCKAGILKYYFLSRNERTQIYAYACRWTDSGRISYYREKIDLLEKVWERLDDDESRIVMEEYVRAFMECGVYNLPQCEGRKKYFYGCKDGVREEIYKHKEDEVWINCGAHVGDTIFLYFTNGLSAKRIYAFEGDKVVYRRLCQNLRWLPEPMGQKVKALNAFIDENTNFHEVLDADRVSLINADIEGSELEMLKSLSEIIKRDRPVLAISAYHRASDLIDIPAFVDTIVDEYEIILRKYEARIECYGRTAELVLYAVPKERRI